MIVLIIFLVVWAVALICFGIIHFVNSSVPSSSDKLELEVKELNTEPDEDNAVFYCSLAGVNFHCSFGSIGTHTGLVYNENTNPHDNRAMAVVDNDGKLYGYIPSNLLAKYKQWCNNDTYPCMINVTSFTDEYGQSKLMGRIGVCRPYTIEYASKKLDEVENVLTDDDMFYEVCQ